jgi:hypothetical protein
MSRKFSIQHVAIAPADWEVQTVKAGAHRVRVAFPPGQGSGVPVQVLHPRSENPLCHKNPAELLLIGTNPLRRCGQAWRKPDIEITDRAAQFRANSRECLPIGPRICAFCGSTRNVEPHHADGNEKNNDRANLVWACRSCNTTIGVVMKRHGLGIRTRQFNPKPQGARTLGQWVTAVLSMKGEGPMEPEAAVDVIHATPPEMRSRFAQQIWQIRRGRGTDRHG